MSLQMQCEHKFVQNLKFTVSSFLHGEQDDPQFLGSIPTGGQTNLQRLMDEVELLQSQLRKYQAS